MGSYDFRTKPNTEWTFYVVDNLPTMSNIYRYDTVQEAIEKYQSLPETMYSAIGSSLQGRYEIDHIHRINSKSVLIRDMDRMTKPIWRESEEIASAVSLMRDQLRVEYEKDPSMFGAGRGSVAIPICDDPSKRSSHLNDKHLLPIRHDRPLSGINEVYLEGQGWVEILDFLNQLEHREWSRETGYPVPFLSTMNVRYVNDRGHLGQVDISPADFRILRDEYERGTEKKPALAEKIAGANAKAGKQEKSCKGKTQSEKSF